MYFCHQILKLELLFLGVPLPRSYLLSHTPKLLHYLIRYMLDPQTLLFEVLLHGDSPAGLLTTSPYAQALIPDQAIMS